METKSHDQKSWHLRRAGETLDFWMKHQVQAVELCSGRLSQSCQRPSTRLRAGYCATRVSFLYRHLFPPLPSPTRPPDRFCALPTRPHNPTLPARPSRPLPRHDLVETGVSNALSRTEPFRRTLLTSASRLSTLSSTSPTLNPPPIIPNR